MLAYATALGCIREQARRLPVKACALFDALGSVCAHEVLSTVSVPPFANSAMDGFALCAAYTASASEQTPLRLPVAGSSAAGDRPSAGAADAWEIMTGAPLPPAYDTIAMVERVRVTKVDDNGRPTEIELREPLPAGRHIRTVGQDFKPGDIVMRAGELVAAEQVMACAALGIDTVDVVTKPSVAVISTGKELVDDAQSALTPGQIRNSNSPYLLAALSAQACVTEYGGVIADDPRIYRQRIADLAQRNDVLVSTGAVSAGRYDYVPDSLRTLGAEILFHKVAVRPGKPLLFARLANGTYYFGLPGNPISAAVGFRFFVIPLLRALQGLSPETLPSALLEHPVQKKVGLRCFYKAHLSIDGNGIAHVDVLAGQESFKIQPLLRANIWAVLPEEDETLSAGQAIQVGSLFGESIRL